MADPRPGDPVDPWEQILGDLQPKTEVEEFNRQLLEEQRSRRLTGRNLYMERPEESPQLYEGRPAQKEPDEWETMLSEYATHPTAGEAAVATAKVAGGEFVEQGSVVAGGVLGAEAGFLAASPFPPAAAVTVPTGTLLGMVGGYFYGQHGKEQGKRAGIYADPEDLPQPLRPYGYAAESFTAGLVYASLPYIGVARGYEAAENVFPGKWVNSVIRTTRNHPVQTGLVEMSANTWAAAGAGVAEVADPGEPKTRIFMEIAGGALNPTRWVARASQFAFAELRASVNMMTEAGRQDAAFRYIKSVVAKSGENPEDIIRALRSLDIESIPGGEGIFLTPAQKSGSPALIAIEQDLITRSREFGEQYAKQTQDSLDALALSINMLRAEGSPKALQAAARAQVQYFRVLFSNKIDKVTQAGIEAARKAAPEDFPKVAEISRAMDETVNLVFKNARDAETSLWNKVFDSTAKTPLGNVKIRDIRIDPEDFYNIQKVYTDLRIEGLPTKGIAKDADEFFKFLNATREQRELLLEGGVAAKEVLKDWEHLTVNHIQRFRSEMLRMSRAAARNPEKAGEARAYGKLAKAALVDMERMWNKLAQMNFIDTAETVLGDFDTARQFSRELNETFYRTFAREAKDRDLPPELLARRALAGGKEATDLKMSDLREASGFMVGRGEDAVMALSQMDRAVHLQRQLFRTLARSDLIDDAGMMDVKKTRAFLSKYADVFDKPAFRPVRDDLEAAVSAAESAKRVKTEMIPFIDRTARRKYAFAKIVDADLTGPFNPAVKYESGVDVVSNAIKSKSPESDLKKLINLAKRGSDDFPAEESLSGLRHAVLDYAKTAATKRGVLSFGEYRNALFSPMRPDGKSVMDVLVENGVYTTDDVSVMNRIFDVADNIEAAFQQGKDFQEVIASFTTDLQNLGAVEDLALRIAGSRIATQFAGPDAGPSLIAAAAGSRYMRSGALRWLHKTPFNKFDAVLQEILQDPHKMAEALESTADPRKQVEYMHFMNSYLWSVGIRGTEDLIQEMQEE